MSNFLYNPDRKSKQQLIAEFVVRTQVLDDIMHDLESSDMSKPEQHYLLVGQRGTGKTTLLHRIKYAVEDNEKLKDWLIPVIFSEEQYNISELANLWESVADVLEDYYGFKGLHSEMGKHIEKKNFEEYCYEILEKQLDTHKKKLVLLVDNVGDLLKKLEDKEVRRLREILQTKNHIRLIASSPFYLDSILDYKQPFFEFFKVKRLDGLNEEEAKQLLLKLGEVHNEKEKIERIIKETPERIETLRILTGGVPRTIALMFRIFIDHEHEDSLKDLERVLDLVTPLYKHRMDDLPKQQQKIVDAVARHWDAISVKELTEKTRLESKIISAQLRQLEKNQIIEKRETNTKNHLYLLKERFWNIWYLMRYGRKTDSERVVWLVRFLESWCSGKDLENRVEDFILKIQKGKLGKDSQEFYSSVYYAIKNLPSNAKRLLMEFAPEYITKEKNIDDNILFEMIKTDIKGDDFNNAFSKIRKIKEPTNEMKETVYKLMSLVLKGDDEALLNTVTNNGKILLGIDEDKGIDLLEYVFIIAFAKGFGIMSLYDGKYQMAKNSASILFEFMKNSNKNGSAFEFTQLSSLLLHFLYKKQYNILESLFSEYDKFNFKDKMKPIYYALVLLKEGEISYSALRMGPELGNLVNAIVKDVREKQKELELK